MHDLPDDATFDICVKLRFLLKRIGIKMIKSQIIHKLGSANSLIQFSVEMIARHSID